MDRSTDRLIDRSIHRSIDPLNNQVESRASITLNCCQRYVQILSVLLKYFWYQPIKNYVRPVRRIGTEIRSGPVRSAVSDRSRTDLGPDRFDENFFWRRAIFKKKVWSDAVDFVKKSLKSEPSSRFLSRSKFEKFACHFLANSADRPRI